MPAPPPHRLETAWQGALAGGGDPASSPLYVFGPFLAALVAAGVANVTFGASIWLAVLTILVVSMLYRLVMKWVVDGSGGTGLAEEELGAWAAKTSASLTCIEYTLTFLVSIAALVTFIADRGGLDGSLLGIEERTWLAVGTSLVVGALVSRGPRSVSRVFGPATAAVLALLWTMIAATIAKRGVQLAPFNLEAFNSDNVGHTLGGFVRILALITGIEVFANLVASYAGPPEVRSRKAFTSLSIIMASTALTMVIVGPAIFALSDTTNTDVSVFTQTMDALLPQPLALAGTVVSVVVLLAAAAASALALESLFLGLSLRHYAPAALGKRNRRGVAARPVWIEVSAASVLFVVLGTHEATYLAIYAAGVFVLLSMTGVAAVLRLARRRRSGARVGLGLFFSVILAAGFTSAATMILFYERYSDGVWLYFLLSPTLVIFFTTVRRMRGDPGAGAERMGRLVAGGGLDELDAAALGHQPDDHEVAAVFDHLASDAPNPRPLGRADVHRGDLLEDGPIRVCIPLDGSAHAERALPYVARLARERPIDLDLLHVQEIDASGQVHDYLALVGSWISADVSSVTQHVVTGPPADAILEHVRTNGVGVVVLTTHGRTGVRRSMAGSVARDLVDRSSRSVVAVRSTHQV